MGCQRADEGDPGVDGPTAVLCVKWTLWPNTVCMECLLPAGGSGVCRVAMSPGYSVCPPLGPQLDAACPASPGSTSRQCSARLGVRDGLLMPLCP